MFLLGKLEHIFRVGKKRGRGRGKEGGREGEKKRALEDYTRLFVFEWILRGRHTNQQGIGPGMLLTVTHQL